MTEEKPDTLTAGATVDVQVYGEGEGENYVEVTMTFGPFPTKEIALALGQAAASRRLDVLRAIIGAAGAMPPPHTH